MSYQPIKFWFEGVVFEAGSVVFATDSFSHIQRKRGGGASNMGPSFENGPWSQIIQWEIPHCPPSPPRNMPPTPPLHHPITCSLSHVHHTSKSKPSPVYRLVVIHVIFSLFRSKGPNSMPLYISPLPPPIRMHTHNLMPKLFHKPFYSTFKNT